MINGAFQLMGGGDRLVANLGDDATEGTVMNGAAKLSAGTGALAQATPQLVAGVQALSSGSATLDGGMQRLAASSPALVAGIAQLSDGTGQLSSAATSASSGARQLASGASSAADGANELARGLDSALEGSQTLSDGLVKFDEQGISKITDFFKGDLKDLKDRVNAMVEVGQSYKNFSGIDEEHAGSVKFIYESDPIEAKDEK